MSLKNMELRYDKSVSKWVWVDTRYAEEPEISEANVRRRFSLLRNGFYPYEFNFLFYIKESTTQCSYCGIFLPSKRLTRDHVYPKSLGGVITTPCCRPCNEAKTNKLPIEWAVYAAENELDTVHYNNQLASLM